ncbi:MAG: hypothetical protein AB8I08_13110 [Sandaracinaceae bacterium]
MMLTLLSTVAHADVIPLEPRGCPPGSVGRSGHMGAYCAPTRCEEVRDCRPYGRRRFECRPAGLCVETRTVWHGRLQYRPLDVVHGMCTQDADCPDGVPCEVERRCVHGGRYDGRQPPVPEEESANVPGAGSVVGLAGLGAVFLGALAWRARRRRAIRRRASGRRRARVDPSFEAGTPPSAEVCEERRAAVRRAREP